MTERSAEAKKAEESRRAQLQMQFENCCAALVNDIAEGELEVEFFKEKVWTHIYVGSTAQIGLWYRTKTIIDLELMPSRPGHYLTIDGDRVCPPDVFSPHWTNDLRFLRTFTVAELEEMLHSIEFLYHRQ